MSKREAITCVHVELKQMTEHELATTWRTINHPRHFFYAIMPKMTNLQVLFLCLMWQQTAFLEVFDGWFPTNQAIWRRHLRFRKLWWLFFTIFGRFIDLAAIFASPALPVLMASREDAFSRLRLFSLKYKLTVISCCIKISMWAQCCETLRWVFSDGVTDIKTDGSSVDTLPGTNKHTTWCQACSS